jgi:glycolate oxidase
MSEPFISALTAAVSCQVVSDPEVLASYARDYARLAPAGKAAALVRARTADDVQATLRFAYERGLPVVTRAGGTGLAGGANAIDGCIVLLVSALNRVLEVNTTTRTAIVEPGVFNATLANAAAEVGLYYPPDPSSREISTIGGNIATNAGGACCLKYGVTGDQVASLKVVLADGTMIQTGSRVAKNVAGLDLNRLMVGSEGTLGVIVEATLRLRRKPGPASTILAFFDTMHDAAQAITAMDKEADLSLLEIMDRTTIQAVESMTHMDLDAKAGALVLAQSDAANASGVVEHCEQLCTQARARSVMRSDDREEGRLLLKARYLALPALERLGTTLLDDVGVPKPAMPLLFDAIAHIAARYQLMIGTFGHAGDGNLHPTIVFDRENEQAKAAAFAAFDEIVHTAMRLGGTITGEHGVGSLKMGYLTQMIGEAERALMHRVKAAFDPRGILNPGKGY